MSLGRMGSRSQSLMRVAHLLKKCSTNASLVEGLQLRGYSNGPPKSGPKGGKATEKRPEKVHVNIGTIGHVDHGKTTLTSAITKVCHDLGYSKFMAFDDIDKAPEEQLRGVTINASHVEYSTGNRHYAHTDCPGHADYVKNMICGTCQMDGAILVVAGSEGQMPQTREHLLLSRQIGLEKIVVYVNKCDLIDKEMQELVELETRELLSAYGFDGDNCPFVFGSAALAVAGDKSDLGEGSIIKLMDALDSYVTLPERDVTAPFLMPVESSMSIPGRGTVAIGTVKQGKISRGEHVEAIGCGIKMKTVATDIHMFRRSISECFAGDHVALLCRSLKVKQLERGMIISAPNTLTMSNRFEGNMYLLSKGEGGRSRPVSTCFVQQLFSRTWSIGCRIDVPDDQGGLLVPGDHGTVHITLPKGMVMKNGQQFIIRENHKTIASGIITKQLASVDIPAKVMLGQIKLPYTSVSDKSNKNTG